MNDYFYDKSIGFELAQLVDEIGFGYRTEFYYDEFGNRQLSDMDVFRQKTFDDKTSYLAPTQSQVQTFFRNDFNKIACAIPQYNNTMKNAIGFVAYADKKMYTKNGSIQFTTYENALEFALLKVALKIKEKIDSEKFDSEKYQINLDANHLWSHRDNIIDSCLEMGMDEGVIEMFKRARGGVDFKAIILKHIKWLILNKIL